MKQPQLGQKILELRNQKGFTQEELVEKCNISVRTIQRIEAGEVMPRSYTIRAILNALDQDLDSFQYRESKVEQHFKELFLLNLDDQKQTGFLIFHLKLAWICGVIYFLSGVPELTADWYRFFEDDMVFSDAGYITIKFIVLISYIYFMRGMILTGQLFKNYLLKISALILIFTNILFYGYDITSVFTGTLDVGYIMGAQSICYGIGGVVLGYALLRLQPSLGIIAPLAGGIKIASSIMFLSIILGWLGYIFLIPAVLLQIILLYKIVEMIKSKQRELEGF